MGVTSEIIEAVRRRCPLGEQSVDFRAECLHAVVVENAVAAERAEQSGDHELAALVRKVAALQEGILRRERREPRAVYG